MRRVLLARGLFVAGLAALALGLVWSWPRARAESDARPIVFALVDVSASARGEVGELRVELDQALTDIARAAGNEDAELCVLAFGEGASMELPPGDALDARALSDRLARRREPASELAAALDLAEHVREEHDAPRGRIVVVGDASFTGEDPGARIAQWSARGFACERRELSEARASGVGLGRIVHPRALPAGTALRVRVPVHVRAMEVARLSAGARWAGREVVREVRCVRPAGALVDPDGFAEWSVAVDFGVVGPGVVELGFTLKSAEDTDLAWQRSVKESSRIVVGSAPTVVLVGTGVEEGTPLERALEADGALFVDHVPVSPDDWSRALQADVVVTLDLPPAELPERELASFVRGGGGWLALLGARSRAAFHSERGAFELLPLVPPRDAPPERDVVFLVDGSGSMSGEAQSVLFGAIVDVLELLAPEESVEFRWFAGALSTPRVRERASDRAAREAFAAALLAEHPPGGPTRIVASLERWIAEKKPDRDALVFVFSDGHDSELAGADAAGAEAVFARARAVAARVEGARARCVPVAIGSGANGALLDALVTHSGRRESGAGLAASDARARLLRLLAVEVAAARSVERGKHAVVPRVDAEGDAGAVVRRQVDLSPLPWPTIELHARAGTAESAEVLWRSEPGDALLANQRVGLGHTAALAFAIDDDAPAWSDAQRLRVLGPLVQALAVGRPSAGPVLTIRGRSIEISGAAGWPARVGAVVRAEGAEDERIVLDADVSVGSGGDLRTGTWSRSTRASDLVTVEVAETGWSGTAAIGPPEEGRFPRRFWRPSSTSDVRSTDGGRGADPRAAWALLAGVVGVFLGLALGRGRAPV